MKFLPICLILFGCHKDSPYTPLEPLEVGDPAITAKEDEVVGRLPAFIDQGFLTSLGENGERRKQGDSLLFTGLAAYALPCKQGQPMANAFKKMFKDRDGGIYRHPTDADDPSLDGLLGLYRGLLHRQSCGDRFASDMLHHKSRTAYLVPPGIDLVQDMVLYKLGLYEEPKDLLARKLELGLLLDNWAMAVVSTKSSCFRIHLALLSYQIMEEAGSPLTSYYKEKFDAITKGLDLPTADYFARRPGLKDWLLNFKYNEWEYRHQRCTGWEEPDGNGLTHPGVDFLVGYADMFGAPL